MPISFTESEIKNHHVFNELDSFGLLLGLKRLSGELNAKYQKRLLDVFVRRANSTNKGLIYGITRELGLEIANEILITSTSSNSLEAISLKGTKLCLYSDYYAGTFLAEYDTWDIDAGAYTIQEVINIINASGISFSAASIGTDTAKRAATLIDCSTAAPTVDEAISGKGIVISLDNQNLVEGSDYVFSGNLQDKVATVDDIQKATDYHIDYISGTITCNSFPESGSYIRYNYTEDELIVEGSPVIIGNLQSEDLREKMFEQVEQPNNEPAVSGRVTHFGADLINELLSVHPLTYNK